MRPPVFLDRDGVINQNRSGYVRTLSDWVPLPGSLEAVARLSAAGHPVVVVTNQSAIARGYTTTEEVERVHDRLRSMVCDLGGEVSATYYCPHHPDDGCDCRKPRTGMVARARLELGLPQAGYLVGDADSDMELGRRVGLRTILVRSGRGLAQLRLMRAECRRMPDLVVDDLSEAARRILGGEPPGSGIFKGPGGLTQSGPNR